MADSKRPIQSNTEDSSVKLMEMTIEFIAEHEFSSIRLTVTHSLGTQFTFQYVNQLSSVTYHYNPLTDGDFNKLCFIGTDDECMCNRVNHRRHEKPMWGLYEKKYFQLMDRVVSCARREVEFMQIRLQVIQDLERERNVLKGKYKILRQLIRDECTDPEFTLKYGEVPPEITEGDRWRLTLRNSTISQLREKHDKNFQEA